MATLKHISSKNSDYSAIEAYLIYQHDAFTGKQLLDEQGKPKLRDSYLLDTLECGDFSFATACLLANRKYGKNTQHGDIKSHQYIISFDPRDAADNGLTMEKARAFYPAILACWNSEEGQREFAAWQAEQVHHTTSKEKQSAPDGERPVVHIAIVCGLWQGASAGRTLFCFALNLLAHGFQLRFSNIPPGRRSESNPHSPAGIVDEISISTTNPWSMPSLCWVVRLIIIFPLAATMAD